MDGFFQALSSYSFLQHALLAGVLASIAAGIAGTYVVVKRISLISGGIAHSILGGMGIAYYFGFDPAQGAVISALIAAVIIGLVSLKARQHEDTVIGALWAVGMAIGIVFIARTPGYNVDLMTFLFGNILLVSSEDLLLIALLDGLILVITVLFYKQFLAVAFDEEHAQLRGMPVEFLYLLLLMLIALTVVILIKIVGLILAIALLTLPPAIANRYAGSLAQMMLLAVGLGMFFNAAGLLVSYQADLPTGATIVLIAGAAYLLALMGRRFEKAPAVESRGQSSS
ncbi:MAG: metal ABC transporter permease [Firmicutes bacterium]|nr:metal ABC transporter permease [Bacillota bacterium]